MPWKAPQPSPAWKERERTDFTKEVWTRIKFISFQWAPGSIAASTVGTFTIATTGGDLTTQAVLGLRVGMPVKLTAPSSPPAGLYWDCAVTANDSLTVWIGNVSGSAETAPSGTWSLMGVVI